MNELKCFFLGHKNRPIRVISGDTLELKCSRCKTHFGFDINLGEKYTLNEEMKKEFDKKAKEYAINFSKKQ